MSFSDFTIRDSNTHSVIDIDIIDRRIKEKFNLDYIDYQGRSDEYCQLYFSDVLVNSFQKSISWAGLLHTIIYYSEIGYGPATTYDIESALSYVSLYLIKFPKSSKNILSNILHAFEEWECYVFVEYHNDYDEKTKCYFDENKNDFLIYTDIGICRCNKDGELVDFIPSLDHKYYHENDWPKEIKKISEFLIQRIEKRYPDISYDTINWLKQGLQNCTSDETVPIKDEPLPLYLEEEMSSSDMKCDDEQQHSIQNQIENAHNSREEDYDKPLNNSIRYRIISLLKQVFNTNN